MASRTNPPTAARATTTGVRPITEPATYDTNGTRAAPHRRCTDPALAIDASRRMTTPPMPRAPSCLADR